MKERVLAKIRTSATPPVATQASSPLLHQSSLTDELSESFGSNSNISKELGGIQPKTIRRSLNWQNIPVEAPSRGNGMSLPGGIQRQQEEPPTVIGDRVSADSVQKSPLESSNSTISTDLPAQKPLIARAPFNGRNIPVEAPSRGNGMSLPGGIQRQQEEPGAVIGERVSADSVQKSALELSNSTISTDLPAQKPLIARAPFNGRNIPVEAPPRSSASSTYPGGIQRLETTGVKEEEESTESLQMQPHGAIQAKSNESEPQEKEEQNKELVQTKLTVGAPGDKYEQEADSMAAKVMAMPDSAIKPPIQRQTGEETEAVQMQPLVNSITPLVQRSPGEEEEVQMKSEVQRASDGSSVASGNVENQLAGSKGGGSPLPDDVRSFMEPRFGADFSSVRVHTDSNAVQMNKELGAQAFAHGSDIYYGAGKSPGKDELTAHELTHTIQQGGAVPTKSVTGQEKKENKLEAKTDAIEANKDKSAVGMPQKQKSVPDATTEAFSAIPASSDETLQQQNTRSDLSANQTIDGLAAPTKDGKPLVKEDSKNDDFTNNNKQASKGDDKSRGGDFQENLISSTIYLPGESFIIQVPASLIVDPRSSFEIQVKTLVQGFGFEENDARDIIQYLSQPGLSTGINLVGVGYSVFSRPDGQRSFSVNMSTDTANYYRKEAANRRQRKSDQGKEQQRIDSERKQQLSKQYLSVLQQYSEEIRNRLRKLFDSLTPTDRESINTQTKEIYREIAGKLLCI
jgi:hypothetical protein